ncbi:MAG: DUF371 domain-containing protein, partial [Acidobacteria bacterium]|nr:DUF371 domain-containing protein [Acidobacteriota bacterium]
MAQARDATTILRFRARGHANLRATHHKTLEITRDPEISLRGTCIVGVAATFDPRSVARLRGPLRLTLEAGGREASLRAVATPFMAV